MAGFRLLCVAVLLGSCGTGTSEAEQTRRSCEQLRDHLIDLRLADVGQDRTSPFQPPTMPKPTPGQVTPPEPIPPPQPVDLEAHRAAMKQALGEIFFGACTSMRADQVKCSLAAKDQDAVNACSNKSAPAVAKTASN